LEANPERLKVVDNIERDVASAEIKTNVELKAHIDEMRAQMDAEPVTPELREELEVAQAVLASRGRRWRKKIEADVKAAKVAEEEALRTGATKKLTRGERKSLTRELQSLRTARNSVTEAEPQVVKKKGVPARKAKADALNKVKAEADEKRAQLTEQIKDLEARLGEAEVGLDAQRDLSRFEQGIYSDKLLASIEEIKHRRLVETDISYYRKIETERIRQAEALPVADEPPVREDIPVTDDLDVIADGDIARFREADIDPSIKVGDDFVSAKQHMDGLEEDGVALEKLREDLKVCAYG
jgi:hypothetical protein